MKGIRVRFVEVASLWSTSWPPEVYELVCNDYNYLDLFAGSVRLHSDLLPPLQLGVGIEGSSGSRSRIGKETLRH